MPNFLPIVQRELRVMARRRSTGRARWWTAVLAMAVSFVALALISVGGRASRGQRLFNVFTGYSFGLCLLAGVLLTADALSEEKREGTLGLLFLTDLKGYDVVLGKFAACSLTAFYCLLALLPMAALPLLLGGVTMADFWRMILALLNALFYSLSAGLCVSAFMRDGQRALGNALGLLLLLVGAVPILAKLSSSTQMVRPLELLAWASPVYPFAYAINGVTSGQSKVYWETLGASNLAAWLFLAAASLALPYCWQERGEDGPRWGFWQPRKRRTVSRRARLREKLLFRYPVAWLVSGDLGIQWRAWAVVLAWAATVIPVMIWWPDNTADTMMIHGYLMSGFGFCLKALFALQVCRFFVETRRNGTLEMLLSTPVTSRDVLNGQVRALWRAFIWPVLVFVGISFIPIGVQVIRAVYMGDLNPVLQASSGLVLSGVNSVRLVVDLVAVCWFGMGLALTMKRPNLAPVMTIISVLILPSVLCWLDVVPALILIAVGLSKCQRDLRRLLAEQYLVSVKVQPETASSATVAR